MPSLVIKRRAPTGTQTVLTLSSVPQSLCESITRGCNSITAQADGMPELINEDESLAICFPQVGLPDWIRYKWTVREDLETEEDIHGQTQGRCAQQASDEEFEHGSIVLLLESPHKQEMENGQPASGQTGRKIEAHRNHFKALLTPLVRQLYSSPTWESLPFVIANPCPYPASFLSMLAPADPTMMAETSSSQTRTEG